MIPIRDRSVISHPRLRCRGIECELIGFLVSKFRIFINKFVNLVVVVLLNSVLRTPTK